QRRQPIEGTGIGGPGRPRELDDAEPDDAQDDQDRGDEERGWLAHGRAPPGTFGSRVILRRRGPVVKGRAQGANGGPVRRERKSSTGACALSGGALGSRTIERARQGTDDRHAGEHLRERARPRAGQLLTVDAAAIPAPLR